MAINTVQIVGDESNMIVTGINLTGVDELLFESGAFIGSSEETRVASGVLTTGAKVFRLRIKWIDQLFNRTDIKGQLIPRGNI